MGSEIRTNESWLVWGLDLSGTIQGAGGVGGLLWSSFGGPSSREAVFSTFDGNGNVSELVSSNGTIGAHYEYDPFGNPTAEEGELADVNPFRFSTKYWNSDTRTLSYQLRDYGTGIARWLSRDPIGDHSFLTQYSRGKSHHEELRLWRRSVDPTYVFVWNSPIGRSDPFGLWPWSRYEEDGNADGSTTITIKKNCTIVVLFGHGLKTKPHSFIFEKPCTAGGFVGCDAGATNTKIPEGNRLSKALLTNGDLILGKEAENYPKEERFMFQLNEAKAGSRIKAKAFCDNKICCCEKVVIYGELAGSKWDPFNARFPATWEETVNCK